MLIKICGITRLEDAEAAVRWGAAALGFVFWEKSPRFIDPFRARAIAAALQPFVACVGVFVNQRTEYVNAVASLVPLSVVQLHGDESVAYAGRIIRPVMKAIGLGGAVNVEQVDAWPAKVTVLLDVHDPERRGGTGRTVDWDQAARIAARRRVVLAGGLTPENVGDAIKKVQPFGVDVSSGVETRPGVKDQQRLRALFDAIRT